MKLKKMICLRLKAGIYNFICEVQHARVPLAPRLLPLSFLSDARPRVLSARLVQKRSLKSLSRDFNRCGVQAGQSMLLLLHATTFSFTTPNLRELKYHDQDTGLI